MQSGGLNIINTRKRKLVSCLRLPVNRFQIIHTHAEGSRGHRQTMAFLLFPSSSETVSTGVSLSSCRESDVAVPVHELVLHPKPAAPSVVQEPVGRRHIIRHVHQLRDHA